MLLITTFTFCILSFFAQVSAMKEETKIPFNACFSSNDGKEIAVIPKEESTSLYFFNIGKSLKEKNTQTSPLYKIHLHNPEKNILPLKGIWYSRENNLLYVTTKPEWKKTDNQKELERVQHLIVLGRNEEKKWINLDHYFSHTQETIKYFDPHTHFAVLKKSQNNFILAKLTIDDNKLIITNAYPENNQSIITKFTYDKEKQKFTVNTIENEKPYTRIITINNEGIVENKRVLVMSNKRPLFNKKPTEKTFQYSKKNENYTQGKIENSSFVHSLLKSTLHQKIIFNSDKTCAIIMNPDGIQVKSAAYTKDKK